MLSIYISNNNSNGIISIPIELFVDATNEDISILRDIKYEVV